MTGLCDDKVAIKLNMNDTFYRARLRLIIIPMFWAHQTRKTSYSGLLSSAVTLREHLR